MDPAVPTGQVHAPGGDQQGSSGLSGHLRSPDPPEFPEFPTVSTLVQDLVEQEPDTLVPPEMPLPPPTNTQPQAPRTVAELITVRFVISSFSKYCRVCVCRCCDNPLSIEIQVTCTLMRLLACWCSKNTSYRSATCWSSHHKLCHQSVVVIVCIWGARAPSCSTILYCCYIQDR